MSKSVPKMPHLMKQVYEQIFKHPQYASLSVGEQFALRVAGAGGYSHCTKENNAYARRYWKQLYAASSP